MNTLSGFHPSWEPFIQSLSGQPKLPKFDCISVVCIQEETRLAVGGGLHGIQLEESKALTYVKIPNAKLDYQHSISIS